MNNQDIGIKKVSQHILRAGKSAVYAASRLSVYYSNSGADEIIYVLFSTHLCHFVFIFSSFYLIFFSHQIIRAKIEP